MDPSLTHFVRSSIKPSRYGQTYDSIVRSARVAQSKGSSTCPVLLIVAMDIDALCACKMLQYLFKQDSIKYRVIPASGWKELSKITEQIRELNSGYKEIVLVNLGAQVDLWQFFNLPAGVRLHVIDSHRPHSLENIFQSGTDLVDDDTQSTPEVIVWDDGHVEDDLQAEKDAFQAVRYLPESDSDLSEDEESEDELGIGYRGKQDLSEEEDADPPRSGDGHHSTTGRKKKKTSDMPAGFSRREIQKFRARLQKYYDGGTHFGQSVACQVYLLITLKGSEDNDLLW